jgi:DNA-directed RNA polymerase specialized sigma24 family protein
LRLILRTMLKLWKPTTSSHEDLFIDRYERLLAWSLKLTGYDRQLAEDLLHDTFVQFTLSRPDLGTIHDLEGYLFAMLRNSHLSHVRRAPNVRTTSLSMVEFDSIEVGLRVTDVQDQIKVQDELRLICHYSTLRKQTSKSGSVLILRFFHGYYPSEIAQVLRSNWQTVGKWLQLARNEARLYLEDPQALGFVRHESEKAKPQLGFARTTEDLLDELRQMISSSRRDDCPSQKQLRETYHSTESTAIDGARLAHIVSCRKCLDAVNQLLGLPLLRERYPTDMTGKDTKGGSGGGPTATGGAGDGIKRSLRRVAETFEHRPKELRIAVNGYVQVSQKVSADRMEQTLSLDLEEKPGFVEIFSEQWIRLFFLNIEPPPDGAFEQCGHIALSEGRGLEANLNFSGSCPNLQVIYHDPALVSESGVGSLESEAKSQTSSLSGKEYPSSDAERGFRAALRKRWSGLGLGALDLGLLFRPGAVTALFALILIAALVLYLRVPTRPVSATELLSRATTAEESIAARTDQVIHRTISLEENSSNGALIARRKIEIWQSAEKGITARRLFDDHGALIAGDWRRSDGVQTLYHHGARPQLQSVPGNRAAASISFDAVWQLDPSAKQFAQLIGDAHAAQVESLPSTYVISYTGNGSSGLIRATLVLSRDDLRAIEQTLVVAQATEVREFRFTEASFERHSPATVAPAVFDPDPELISSARPDTRTPTPDARAVAPGPQPPTPTVATAELEVEVLHLLNQVGADLNDQTSVTRTSDGKLRIGGLVDTDQQKAEIVRALAPVSSNPAVQIQIETVAEAVRRQVRPGSSPAGTTVERVEIAQARMAAYEDLRRYFGKDESRADEEIKQFAARMLNQSSQAMSQAGTMRRLARQFSQEDLRTMSLEAKAKWIAVIRAHARTFEQQTRLLRIELQPIFFPDASADQSLDGIQITDDASLIRAVERLFEQGSANDDVIRSAFAVTSETARTSAIKTPQFWRSLVGAEKLSARIANNQ